MIYPQQDLEKLIKQYNVTTCAFAYSDVNYGILQNLAARCTAAGAQFVQLPPRFTELPSSKPVIAICATRTGTGKSQTTRFVCDYLKKKGLKVAVARHPMPYDQNLLSQRCQRYEVMEDLVKYNCTIEEREEYELHIEEGNLLFAGVDYEMILREMEKEADVVIWDGGNNDFPFFRPDVQITVADALRAGHGLQYFPGEVNLLLADVVLINKVNSLPDYQQAVVLAERNKKIVKKGCPVLFGNSVVTAEARDSNGTLLSDEEACAMIRGKRVLVIDDGPTLTHGEMPFGAGYVLANKLCAGEVVDPRPYAKGSLVGVFEKFKHLERVLPAMGYGEKQIKDLEATVHAVDCDVVVGGTPIDLSKVVKLDKPYVRTRYNLEVVPEHHEQFIAALDSVFDRFAARSE
jgi:predicted GTPase